MFDVDCFVCLSVMLSCIVNLTIKKGICNSSTVIVQKEVYRRYAIEWLDIRNYRQHPISVRSSAMEK